MECKQEKASHCLELVRFYIKKKDLVNALKYSVKAYKLYPITVIKCELKCLFIKKIRRIVQLLIYTFILKLITNGFSHSSIQLV